jgi:hypothetical protein
MSHSPGGNVDAGTDSRTGGCAGKVAAAGDTGARESPRGAYCMLGHGGCAAGPEEKQCQACSVNQMASFEIHNIFLFSGNNLPRGTTSRTKNFWVNPSSEGHITGK